MVRRTFIALAAGVLLATSMVASSEVADAVIGLTAPGPVGSKFTITDVPGENSAELAGKPAIASDGVNFLIVWRLGFHFDGEGDVYAARVTRDGVVLDDPPIAVRISGEDAMAGHPAVAFDGTNYLVVWAESPDPTTQPWELRGRRISPSGTLLDAGVLELTTTASLKPYRQLGIAFGETDYMIAFRTNGDDVRVVRVTTAGVNRDDSGVSIGSGFYPGVAFDGNRFLVVYHANGSGSLDELGAFVDQDGVVASGSPFIISDAATNQEHSTVVFNGTHYLVTWYDWDTLEDDEMEGRAYAARVATDGTVDPPFLLSERVRGQVPVQLTTDGTDFLAVWGAIKTEAGDFRHLDVMGRRINSDGNVVDEQPISIATGAWHDWAPVVGSLGSRHLVAWTGLSQWANQSWGVHGQIIDTSLPGDAAPTGTTGAGGGGWTDLGALPTAFVSAILAFAPDDVFAFGEGEFGSPPHGGVFHDDGSGWTVVDTPVDPINNQININRKWAIASFDDSDIWAVGYGGGGLRRRDGSWAVVTCCGSDVGNSPLALGGWTDGHTVFGVLGNGGVQRGFGPEHDPGCPVNGWCWYPEASGTTVDLSDVWGIRADNLIAVGEHGTILRRSAPAWYVNRDDPASWTADPDVPTSQRLNAVDGSAPDDVWVVGDAGTILNWNGTSWTRRNSGTVEDLLDVWVARPDDVWAVGMNGTIIHYDGLGWWMEDSGTTLNLTAVGGVVDPGTWREYLWVGDADRARSGGRSTAAGLWGKDIAVTGTPLARRDAYTINEDTPLFVGVSGGVRANDADPEGETLAVVLDQPPERGVLSLAANGSFTYTPAAEYSGSDFFTYHVTDGVNDSITVLVRLVIAPLNDPPVAVDDEYLLRDVDELHVPPLGGFLDNDVDVDTPPPYTAQLVTGPTHGTLVTFTADGGFAYRKAPGVVTGTDSFTYRISDGTAWSAPATVTIQIDCVTTCPPPPNRPPTAKDDVAATTAATAVLIDVMSNDNDPDVGQVLSVSIATPPAHGQATIMDDGRVRYTGDGFVGIDTFSYALHDDRGGSDTATVHVAVGDSTSAGHVGDGGSIEAGGQHLDAPVRAEVRVPTAGPIAVSVHPGATDSRSGWSALGWGVDVFAESATAAAPIVIQFDLIAGLFPPGDDPAERTVFRNGAPVPVCTGSGAVPDPCVASLTTSGDGSTHVTIRTSSASTWSFGTAPAGRLQGPPDTTRIETAVAISQAVFPAAETAVLARSDGFADALAGGPLAASLDAPLLLTGSGGLDAAVRLELQRLGVSTLVLLGGPSALSQAVEDQARGMGVATVRRIGGTDRFDTARLIAREVGGTAVYVALGDHVVPTRAWPDALAVSALAAYQRRPLLLVTSDQVPDATRRALAELGVNRATLIGGSEAISLAVRDEIATMGIITSRIEGDTRYDTSSRVANEMTAAGMNPIRVWFTSGANWPDALAAGPAAGLLGAPVLLVHPSDLDQSPSTGDWLRTHASATEDVIVVGGPAAVSEAVEANLQQLATP